MFYIPDSLSPSELVEFAIMIGGGALMLISIVIANREHPPGTLR